MQTNDNWRVLLRGAIVVFTLTKAIADFTKAMEINPENVSFYVNRGVAKEMIGDLDGACADWKEASFRGDKDSSGWVDDQCQGLVL